MNSQIWGKALWIMLHTFGEKVNPYFFKDNIKIILYFTNELLQCIPCEFCKKHAIQYIRKNNLYTNIRNRCDFIHYFYRFHNAVNATKNIPTFISIEIYKNYNLGRVIYFFNKYYTNYNVNRYLFLQNKRRHTVSTQFVEFIKNNCTQFI